MAKGNAKRKRKLPRRRATASPGTAANSVSAPVESGSIDSLHLIQHALGLQQAGRLDEAKQTYCAILAQDPSNADAWHLLGMLLYSANSLHDACDCLLKACRLNAHSAEWVGHLAIIQQAMGEQDSAEATFRQAISMDPKDADLRNNFGVFLLETLRMDEAHEQLSQATQIDPQSSNAAMNLANCWLRMNRLHDAETVYRNLLDRFGERLDILSNLGECLRRQCRWSEAVDVLQRVVALRPEDLTTQITLGRTLKNLHRFDEALKLFQALAKRFPQSAKVFHYLGQTHFDLGDIASAEREIAKALELDENDAQLLCTSGFLKIESDQRGDAQRCFSKAIEINPLLSEAHGCLLYLQCGDPDIDPDELFEAHRRWGEIHGKIPRFAHHRNPPDPERRIRIGYASGDFRDHAVAKFFEPLLRLSDKQRFETFCYSESHVEDDVTRRLRALSDHWRSTLGYSDEQVAKQIHDDKIDILMDLAGHTSGNRLTAFALKPAPIQLSWLGYPNTTGLPAIDYTFSCEIQNPLDEPTRHTETVLRIPGGSSCFVTPQSAPDVSALPAERNGHITFGSLHRPFKISPLTQDLWAAAMHACPTAKLIIFNTRFNDTSRTELSRGLEERGVDTNRFEIRNQIIGDSYLETYHEIDIGLDASPWAGGTTTMEALWMGIPVIAFYGKTKISRGTAGIVHHLGHPEWIARSIEEYGELIRTLASDTKSLANLRGTLRGRTRETIGNQGRFVSEVEKAYREMWRHWCSESSRRTNSLPPGSGVTIPSAPDVPLEHH